MNDEFSLFIYYRKIEIYHMKQFGGVVANIFNLSFFNKTLTINRTLSFIPLNSALMNVGSSICLSRAFEFIYMYRNTLK